jgi:hypothetical protein
MIKSFNDYVKESAIGALSIQSRVNDLNQPDSKNYLATVSVPQGRSNYNRTYSGPNHWGGRFGANPENKKTKKKMNVKSFEAFQNAEKKKIEEQNSGVDLLNVPEAFKADQTAITSLRDEITNIKQQLATKEADLNNKITELQNKIAAKNQQGSKSGTVQGTANAQQQTPTA